MAKNHALQLTEGQKWVDGCPEQKWTILVETVRYGTHIWNHVQMSAKELWRDENGPE
jgi:hypothetical protein